jgi:hypothetical protein
LQRIKYHELSSAHIGNSIKLVLCGKVGVWAQIDEEHRIAVACHNELVHKNRHNLSIIIDCFIFCGHYEISVQGGDELKKPLNRVVFLDL